LVEICRRHLDSSNRPRVGGEKPHLTITVSATPVISQPGAFSSGTTVVRERADIQLSEGEGRLMFIGAAPKLEDVVRAINLMGASTQDLMHILEAMKAAGALVADLVVL
jgi:flagellar P-ring protein precursor FlgI